MSSSIDKCGGDCIKVGNEVRAICTDHVREYLDSISPDRHPFSQRFHDILEELGDLHDRKQADYGRDDDPFANVRGSEDFGVPAWVGAMVRLNDKVRRLQKAARGGQLVNEGVIDSFNDLAVYAVIARVLYEERLRGDA